ncbi:uncharacterized protein LOC131668815 [Phymastichus coffea]|uniref:uncharacterized protein LOC131668815 n=1 Tax=Phymastichus coffea TaxID=108790 RepID=UPI00273AB388|nr:uncharacterized protein LOC131668815 [Phymastichus coffea]
MSAREVALVGGSPWGFRMVGGCDQNQPLRISRRDKVPSPGRIDNGGLLLHSSWDDECSDDTDSASMVHMSYAQWACLPSTYRNKVNPGSKAAQQGVREGDLISSINGKSTRELTNVEAHGILRNAGDSLKLGLNQENGSPKRRIYKSSLQENTSIETIKKVTTTKTTTTSIISTEAKKNGTEIGIQARSIVVKALFATPTHRQEFSTFLPITYRHDSCVYVSPKWARRTISWNHRNP